MITDIGHFVENFFLQLLRPFLTYKDEQGQRKFQNMKNSFFDIVSKKSWIVTLDIFHKYVRKI
jgi:hypothetical protein